MKSGEQILFDYQTAINQAKKIESIAYDFESNARNNMENALETLSGSWYGSNAKTYYSKGTILQSDMIISVGKLREIATEIRETAQRVYQMEQANLQIVEERPSS